MPSFLRLLRRPVPFLRLSSSVPHIRPISFIFWLPSAFVFQSLPEVCSAQPENLLHHTLVRPPLINLHKSVFQQFDVVPVLEGINFVCSHATPQHLPFMSSCLFLFQHFLHTHTHLPSSCIGDNKCSHLAACVSLFFLLSVL